MVDKSREQEETFSHEETRPGLAIPGSWVQDCSDCIHLPNKQSTVSRSR